jgi:hypothetical protein
MEAAVLLVGVISCSFAAPVIQPGAFPESETQALVSGDGLVCG